MLARTTLSHRILLWNTCVSGLFITRKNYSPDNLFNQAFSRPGCSKQRRAIDRVSGATMPDAGMVESGHVDSPWARGCAGELVRCSDLSAGVQGARVRGGKVDEAARYGGWRRTWRGRGVLCFQGVGDKISQHRFAMWICVEEQGSMSPMSTVISMVSLD